MYSVTVLQFLLSSYYSSYCYISFTCNKFKQLSNPNTEMFFKEATVQLALILVKKE